jgi:hypothetical protein
MVQVIVSPSALIFVSRLMRAAGIGMVKDISVPPLGQGKVIVLATKSTPSSGIAVSRSLHPVANPISKLIPIQQGRTGELRADLTRLICSGVKGGKDRILGEYLIR